MPPRRTPSGRELLKGLLRQYPFVLKNFKLYFRNLYRREILKSTVVAPYAAVFYATHKCNLDCSYCTQKEPDVFSDELPTDRTIDLLRLIRRETDSILFTGGEPLLRPDIEELVRAARGRLKFRSVMLVTNGSLLHKRERMLDSLSGLIVSLDSLTPEPGAPLSKSGIVPRVLENLQLARGHMGKPSAITISVVIEEWNIAEVERILDYCRDQGFVFSAQSAQTEKQPNLRLLENARYRALAETIIQRRRAGEQPINGTPKLLKTLLQFGDFQCFPTFFPRVYPNGDVFYPCEPLKKIGGNLFREGSFNRVFARGRKLYGEVPQCKAICYLFGNVVSSYYVNDFWGLAGDSIR